jgi:Double zinc ribbon
MRCNYCCIEPLERFQSFSTSLMPPPRSASLTPQGEPLADYIIRIRTLRGMTKTELSRRASVHITSVLRLEGGKVAGLKMRLEVQKRLAGALQIPVEYLQAACRNESLENQQTNFVCPSCWVPGTSPDIRWSLLDANFCLRCGEKLRSTCSCCEETLLLTARFCPHCGQPYRAAAKSRQSLSQS